MLYHMNLGNSFSKVRYQRWSSWGLFPSRGIGAFSISHPIQINSGIHLDSVHWVL